MSWPQKTANPASITINAYAAVDEVVDRRANSRSTAGTYYGGGDGSFDIYAGDPVFSNIEDPTLKDNEVLSVWNLAGRKGEKPYQIQDRYAFVGFCGGDGFKFTDPTGYGQVVERASPAIAIVVGGLLTIEWKGHDKVRKGDYFYWELKENNDPQIVLPKEQWGRIYAEYKIYKPTLSDTIKSQMSKLAFDDSAYQQAKMNNEKSPIEEGLFSIATACKTLVALGVWIGTGRSTQGAVDFSENMTDNRFEKLVLSFLFNTQNATGMSASNDKLRLNIIHDLFRGVLRADWDVKSRIMARSFSNGYTGDRIDVHVGNLTH